MDCVLLFQPPAVLLGRLTFLRAGQSGLPPYGRHIAKRSGVRSRLAKIPGRLPIIKDYALMRRALSLLAKITISILLLYLSLRSVDLAALGARLSRLESGWFVLALFLLTVQVMLLAVRWRNISAACCANLPFILALQIGFIATFFNQVLPSTVGGDGMRIWLFARKGAGWASATYSVLIDRIAGVFVLALIVIACLPVTFSLIHDPIGRAILLVIGVGVIAGTLVFVLIGQRFGQWFDRWMLTRHLFTDYRGIVQLPPQRRERLCVLGRNPSDHRRGSVVLRQSGRFTGQFRANSVPHAARTFGRYFADIDRRLGRP